MTDLCIHPAWQSGTSATSYEKQGAEPIRIPNAVHSYSDCDEKQRMDLGLAELDRGLVIHAQAKQGIRGAAEEALPDTPTCRPCDPEPAHSGIHSLYLQARASLNTGDLREAIRLPAGVERIEWIGAQVFGIMEDAEHTVCMMTDDLCNATTCPCMTAGKGVTYLWSDEANPKSRLQHLPAAQYMHRLIDWSRVKFREAEPPVGEPFPENYKELMSKILRRLFRVYAHAYKHHFQGFQRFEADAHLRYNFKRFLFVVEEFDLVPRGDMMPLKLLVEKFLSTSPTATTQAAPGD